MDLIVSRCFMYEKHFSSPPQTHTHTRGGSGGAHVGRGRCRRHRVAWEMESKLALDASECGHGQPEASDVVGVGRRQADPRLGGGLGASRLSVVCGEREMEEKVRDMMRERGAKKEVETRRREETVQQHKHCKLLTHRGFIIIIIKS